MAITPGADIEAEDFINESEADPTPSNDAGKVPKLEADGKISRRFTGGGEIVEMTAGETITGATLPVPVYYNPSDGEVYICDPEDSSTGGSRKGKFVGFAISTGNNGDPIDVQIAGLVDGFSGLTLQRNYYLDDTPGTIGLYNKSFNGRSAIKVGRSISATQLLIERGERFYSDGHLAHNDEVDTTVHECGFLPERIVVTIFPNYSGASTQMIYSRAVYELFKDGDEYGGSGQSWTYEPDGNPSHSVSGSPSYEKPDGTDVLDVEIVDVTDIGFTIVTTPLNSGANQDARVRVEAHGHF